MNIITNPIVKWESDKGNILRINNADPLHTLPSVGDIITRSFLVEPATNQRIAYRVVETRENLGSESHTYVVVVRPLGQYQ